MEIFGNPVSGYRTEYYSAMIEYQKKKSDESSEAYAVNGILTKGNIYFGSGKIVLNPKIRKAQDKLNVNKKSKISLNNLEGKIIS